MQRMVTFLIMAVITYAGICALVFLLQGSLLFFPRASDPHAASQLQRWQRSVDLPEATLSGWLIPADDPANAPLVFYFGGNAEDVSLAGLELSAELDASFVLMNYRGYGTSEGSPSETALFSDALLVYDTLVDTNLHNGKVVALGRSLGSGVAVYLASHRHIDALVLVTPYDSIRNVARRHYAWLPVSLLIKHPFDSVALAAVLDTPALFIVAERDEVIPPSHAHNLADHWGGSEQRILIEGATHNSISEEPNYWSSLREFLASL